MLSDWPEKPRLPAHRTVIVVGAPKLATACSAITACLGSAPSCTVLIELTLTIPQKIEFVGNKILFVVSVTVDVNMIQYWPAGTSKVTTSRKIN